MADLVITEALLAVAHKKTGAFVATKTSAPAADTVTIYSKDEYGESLSLLSEFGWGDTDDRVVAGQLFQKALQAVLALTFWVGNRIGYDAVNEGKERNSLGLAL